MSEQPQNPTPTPAPQDDTQPQGQPQGQAQPTPKPAGNGSGPGLPPEVLAGFNSLVERLGGMSEAAARLYQENYQLREKLREVRSSLPPEGAVVLPPDAAPTWQKVQELLAAFDNDPDRVAQALEQGRQALDRLTQLERQELVRKAARLNDYRPEVLAEILGDVSLLIEEEGETATAYVVLKEGDEEKRMPLSDWVQEHKAHFLPALKVQRPATGNRAGPVPAGIAKEGLERARQEQSGFLRRII